MADKPKTYPQQIQELKQQLEDALTDTAEAQRQASFIPELQQQISDLKAKLEAGIKADNHNAARDKSQWTDLEQRAVSAEQGMRNANARIGDLEAAKRDLEAQLNLVAIERDKESSRRDKSVLISEELKTERLHSAQLYQQNRDLVAQHEKDIAANVNELRYLRELARKQSDAIQEHQSAVLGKAEQIENLTAHYEERLRLADYENQVLTNRVNVLQKALHQVKNATDSV